MEPVSVLIHWASGGQLSEPLGILKSQRTLGGWVTGRNKGALMSKLSVECGGVCASSEQDDLTIGSAADRDLVIGAVAAEVAIIKYRAKGWLLRLKDRNAQFSHTDLRSIPLVASQEQIEIVSPGSYELALDVTIDEGTAISAVSPVTVMQSMRISYPQADLIIVGSAADADLRINFPSVDARHAVIQRHPCGTWIVKDQGSSTGTKLNGQGVTRAGLTPGDTVAFGGVELTWPTGFNAKARTPENSGGRLQLPPPSPGSSFPRADSILIGSSTDVDVRLDDPSVDARHASIHRRDGNVWVIADRGSSKGTLVNGDGITRAALKPNDLISFGGVSLRWPDDFVIPAGVSIRPPIVASKKTGQGRPAVALSGVTVGYPGKRSPQGAVKVVF